MCWHIYEHDHYRPSCFQGLYSLPMWPWLHFLCAICIYSKGLHESVKNDHSRISKTNKSSNFWFPRSDIWSTTYFPGQHRSAWFWHWPSATLEHLVGSALGFLLQYSGLEHGTQCAHSDFVILFPFTLVLRWALAFVLFTLKANETPEKTVIMFFSNIWLPPSSSALGNLPGKWSSWELLSVEDQWGVHQILGFRCLFLTSVSCIDPGGSYFDLLLSFIHTHHLIGLGLKKQSDSVVRTGSDPGWKGLCNLSW